jgi:hypothetical protein
VADHVNENEFRLWEAADSLWANTGLKRSEFSAPEPRGAHLFGVQPHRPPPGAAGARELSCSVKAMSSNQFGESENPQGIIWCD